MTEDLAVDLHNLPAGYFYTRVMLSNIHLLAGGYDDEIETVKKHVEKYLSLLPPGTKHVTTQRQAVNALSIPYLVIFSNPVMNDFREVDITYIRCACPVDGHLEQFNLLTGILYTKRDGTRLGA